MLFQWTLHFAVLGSDLLAFLCALKYCIRTHAKIVNQFYTGSFLPRNCATGKGTSPLFFVFSCAELQLCSFWRQQPMSCQFVWDGPWLG